MKFIGYFGVRLPTKQSSFTNQLMRVFYNVDKITPLRTRNREIASGMQQCLAELLFRTSSTEPRNDEGWRKRRESHHLCKKSGMTHVVTNLPETRL
jgi:hypothetical protein